LIGARPVGTRLELIVVRLNDEHQQQIARLKPLSQEVIDLNLEDAFIEYTRGPRRSLPVFGGEPEHVESIGV
jgi:ABC-2 type transport system ATP-binding protein